MNLYVGNLSFSTSSEDLAAMFRRFGEVTSAQVITDRDTGRSRGFGFVEMANDDEARAAIEEMNDTDQGGRRITVNEARPRAPRREGGGGGFRGGRGGGGGGDRGGRGGGDRGGRGGGDRGGRDRW